jgi:hypothetical protein
MTRTVARIDGKVFEMRFNKWLQTAPLGVTYTWIAIIWIGIRFLFQAFSREGIDSTYAVINVAGGLIFAGVMTGIVAVRRRRSGGAGTLYEINRSLKTGQIPEHAEPSIWMPALERRERSLRRTIWLGPLEFGIFALLSLWLLFLGPLPLLPLILFAAFIALIIWVSIATRRQNRQVERLRSQFVAPGMSPTR